MDPQYNSSQQYSSSPYSSYNAAPAIPGGWLVVSRGHMIGFAIGTLIFWLLILTARQQFVFIVDHVNLAIHEAGHIVFLPFGDTLQMWGGTLLQCMVPLGIGVYFWLRRQTAGVAVAGLWLGENFLNVARYAADAKARALPLVGGGRHDWQFIFNKLGCINSCETIASGIYFAGWVIMIAAAMWYVWRWRVSEEYAQQNATSH